MSVPSFNFDAFKPTLDDAAVAAELSKRDRLQPGEHELEILDISNRGYSEKEPTWLKFSLVLGRPGTKAEADGKFKGAIYHTTLVPTVDITYNGGLNVFGMLQGFFAGLGQRLVPSNSGELIKQYFADFGALKGMKLKVVIGYQGNHIVRRDDKFIAVDKAGNPLQLSGGNSFDNYDAAFGAAAVEGIKIERYLNVLRILPGDLQEPAKKDEKKSRKPTVSFGE